MRKELEKLDINITDFQSRFENWANEDRPIEIDPKSIDISDYQNGDLDGLSNVYMKVFNAQNKRKYANISGANLAWDEDPWTKSSAKKQLEEELGDPNAISFVAKGGKKNERESRPIGFIIARKVGAETLSDICGSEKIANQILEVSNDREALLWEDAGVINMTTPDGKTIRGVGTSLYQKMADVADEKNIPSIGRTAPGSFAEKILPKVGFENQNPPINDGKDQSRYWLIRKRR